MSTESFLLMSLGSYLLSKREYSFPVQDLPQQYIWEIEEKPFKFPTARDTPAPGDSPSPSSGSRAYDSAS